ncbi:MAG: peptidase M16 [Porticoccaceae bacterium]|nr:peptidase M16 [Porticoccaceae bacterium]
MSEPVSHSAFEFIRRQSIASLNVTVEEYRHRASGAQHIHLASDSPENVFLVALRTVPEDSTGVAHILEHTALCGSEKYPVRDPFFMMIRRSLNTFMNAMTSSDWTAYPFASQNRKDYFNLLDVYLDAVFFSTLDELDFAQEGHRLEFAEAGNADSDLVFKGVVFNEMKGAMSSVTSTLWHTLSKYLYPSTTYHHNSGGDPECIPDLTYQQLKDFYRTHYHPSNAVFMTFGDIPAAELQGIFEQRALSRFDVLEREIAVPDEKRYLAPVRVEEAYAFDEEGPADEKTHIVLGWLLGASTDLLQSLEAHLLSSVLLDNSASPLLRALETTDLGTAPSPLCGLDDSQKELCFVCGIEGSEPERARAFEQLVENVLTDVANNGIAREQLEASLHQLELQQREITGDHYPYGLQLLMTALTSATHRGDPIALLDLDPVLDTLRERIQNPDYIKQLAQRLLLDNRHRITLTLRPDPELSARRVQAEMSRLARIKEQLSDEEKARIVAQAEALKVRQSKKDDESILPKVGLADIPESLPYTSATERLDSPLPLTTYATGTNGLVYQQVVLKLPAMSEEQLDLLPLYANALTELGVGERDYLETQLWQSRVCGSINAHISARGTPDDLSSLSGHMVLSAKGLARYQGELSELMQETLNRVRFDELDRIRDLIAQSRARREASITGSGHALAMSAAACGISPGAALSHRWGGLQGIRFIKKLDKSLAENTQLEQLARQLADIHALILTAPRQYLAVGEEQRLEEYKGQLWSVFGSEPVEGDAGFSPFGFSTEASNTRTAWKTSTQVNFCARAYATVPLDHPDAAPLSVLGGFLRNGYLHTAIREQGGAYGGGASQDNHSGVFRFFSYRDPRLAETLADFDASLDWLNTADHDWQQVEEAILGVISSIDKPASPAGEAKQTFHAELYGNTREIRERFRTRVLGVTLADLKRVASTYLTPDRQHSAVITHPDKADALADVGYSLETL